MRRQQQELMRWHLADTASDKRHSCSQSVRTLLHLVLSSVFFTADVTQKTVTLAIHSEEPVTVSNSPLDSYLLERQLICTRSHKHTPLLFLAILSLCLSLFLSPLSFSLSLPPLLPLPLFRPGQMEHFSTLAPGALVR